MIEAAVLPIRLSRRRLLLGTATLTGAALLAGCFAQQEEVVPAVISPEPSGPRLASNLALQDFWHALNNAAVTLGATKRVRFSVKPFGATPEEHVDDLLGQAGISARHRNYEVIRELYTLGVASVTGSRKTVDELAELKALAEPVLERAYDSALGECERNMPTCNSDITTKFKTPGSPGGAPDWVTAWWGFSSPD